jgi:hypothetical protein
MQHVNLLALETIMFRDPHLMIGETSTGKPIYNDANYPTHSAFTAADHAEAYEAHVFVIDLVRLRNGLKPLEFDWRPIPNGDSLVQGFQARQCNVHRELSIIPTYTALAA